ncbi:N-alpha-acetyltransferase 60 isoform X2 [Culicoides brevitarsis]|uniref:N-alpha-acetyltransferase 60 isoform X2 n=1 Tax=Culicoides brevitarsis TaxID=469753 RepID=UPI00307C5CA4
MSSWHFAATSADSSRDECFCETLDPQAIRLRFLCPEDIAEIQTLCQDWFPISYPKEWYEQIVTPKYYSLVALYEKTIIGLIVCEIKPYHRLNREDRDILPSTFSGCEVGYILSLGVHKKFRRKGIGSLLLDTFLRFITSTDKQNVKALFLHVLTTNQAAIIFYEKRQFRYHAFLPYYYSIKGRSRDAFFRV